MPEAPLLYDRYRVARRLGSGAFATVYLADDLSAGRQVAIKVVEQSRDLDDRVLREAEAVSKLSHPHIVSLYEMVREPERTLLVSEYIDGRTLRDHYGAHGLTDSELLEVGVQLCRALDHAHRRGVVHRDVKPENIMLVEGEGVDVRLMDFGVAQLEDRSSITADGHLVGTLAYMSPEQLEGRNVDSRTDVYSLALTLYEGFVGRNPFRGKNLRELLESAARPDIPKVADVRPDLPRSLGNALHRALTRDRYRRPDAATLGRMLTAAALELPRAEERAGGRRRLFDAFFLERLDRGRVVYVAQHLGAAGFSVCSTLYLLTHAPFYPPGWIFPAVAICGFIALIWPLGGGILSLLSLVPPIFAFSVGWGIIFVVVAAALMAVLRWRRLEWAALLAGVMPLAAAGGFGLAIPAFASVAMRRWGPVGGFMSGLALAVTTGLAQWDRLPYVFTSAGDVTLFATRHVASPVAVIAELGRFLQAQPELLLQTTLFALFGFPLYTLVPAFGIGGLSRRLWGGTAYLGLMAATFLLAPILALGSKPDLPAFLVAFIPCVIIGFLAALVAPSQSPGTV